MELIYIELIAASNSLQILPDGTKLPVKVGIDRERETYHAAIIMTKNIPSPVA